MSKLGVKVNNLISEIKNGNSSSFKELYDTTYNHLKIVAYNYLFDSSDIEDVLNETYLKISLYINSADEKKDGYNWMCKIVQNIAYNFNNKRQVVVPINKIENRMFFYEIDDSIIENSQLYKIIQTFDASEQKIVYLRFWEDLSLREIAQKTGIKKSTVNKRIKSLLKKIRNEFGD